MNLYIDHPGTKIHAHLFWTQKRSLFIQAARYCCPNGTPVLRQSTKIHLGRSWPTWGFPYNDGTPLSLDGFKENPNLMMITRGIAEETSIWMHKDYDVGHKKVDIK